MTTGDLLTAYRMQKGWTVDEASDRTGIPPEKLMELESGRLPADDYVLGKLGEAYGVSPDALRSDDPGYEAPPVEPARGRPYAAREGDAPGQGRPRVERGSLFGSFVRQAAQGASYEPEEDGARDLSGLGRWMTSFPFPLVVVAVFLLLGFTLHLWHPAWILFLLIPVWYRLGYAFKEPDPRRRLLKMPAITGSVFLYVCAGVINPFNWLWAWVVFPMAALYYWRVFVYGKLW